MKNVSFMYMGRTKKSDPKHNGVICVNYAIDASTENIMFSVAFCSPEDEFVKNKAHLITSGRLEKGLKVHRMPLQRADNGKFLVREGIRDVIRGSLQDDTPGYKGEVAGIKIPRWVTQEHIA